MPVTDILVCKPKVYLCTELPINPIFKLAKAVLENKLQSSAVITRSNITCHCIHHCRKRVYQLKSETTKDTPYLALTGELWVSFVNIVDKFDRVITAPHCTYMHDYAWQKSFLIRRAMSRLADPIGRGQAYITTIHIHNQKQKNTFQMIVQRSCFHIEMSSGHPGYGLIQWMTASNCNATYIGWSNTQHYPSLFSGQNSYNGKYIFPNILHTWVWMHIHPHCGYAHTQLDL